MDILKKKRGLGEKSIIPSDNGLFDEKSGQGKED